MNTCAECRFWKAIDLEHRAFYGVSPVSTTPSGEFKECQQLREDRAAAFVLAQGSDDTALMTRGDFGCVQFERNAVTLTGIPIGLPVTSET